MPEGPHLAQLLPAAPKFRLRRVTLPLRAAHLGVCSAVANGGVAKGFDPCLAECLRVPMPHGCTERRWSGLDQL